MTKRIWALFCCAILILSLFGCWEEPASDPPATENEAPADEVDPTKDDSYKQIVCEEPASLKRVHLSFGQDLTIFSTPLPSDWQLTADGTRGYRIQKGGKTVGEILPTGNGGTDGVCVATEQDTANKVAVTKAVYRYEENGGVSFRRQFDFQFKDKDGTPRSVTLDVDYAALDDHSANRVVYSVRLDTNATDPNFDLLELTAAEVPRVLILGNSFVGSSDIGNILRSMAGEELNVTAISVGMARVEKYATYSEHASLRNAIADGDYDVVFLCGFYKSEDVSHLSTMAELCRKGGAELVVFPAHNEGTALIQSLGSSTKVLDWQGEINTFIKERGVDYYDMCVDDTYNHSKPLAGYVGAHMIYRAVLGKAPAAKASYGSSLSHTYVQSMLGAQYVATGTVPKDSGIDPNSIYYFS